MRTMMWVGGTRLGHGELLPDELAGVELVGSGLQLGDGVFTTLRVAGRLPLDLSVHVERLRRDAARVGLDPPPPEAVEAAAHALAEQTSLPPDHVLRLTVVRAAPLPGAPFGERSDHVLLLGVGMPAVAPPATLRAAVVLGARRPAEVKSISWAWSASATAEARDRGADVALLVEDGQLLEAAAANVVVVGPDGAVTPTADGRLLSGTTRATLLDADVGLRPTLVAASSLRDATEVVLLSAVSGVVPVVSVDGRPVGDSTPGPWASTARAALEARGWPADWPAEGA